MLISLLAYQANQKLEILISDASYKSPDCKTNSSQKLFQKLEMKESTIELKGKSDALKVYIGSMCASS